MIATRCLSEPQLNQFASGECSASQFDQLLAHLDECSTCQSKALLRENRSDRFAALLRNASGESGAMPEDPVFLEPDCGAALLNASSLTDQKRYDLVLPPVERLGPYRLIRPLGRGGMGAVYLAEHTRLKKQCAIKLLPRERGFDTAWLERFDREMQAVASLNHPSIVTATDAGDVDGWHYLVMEYLDGLDLAAVVRRLGPLRPGVAATIMAKVTDALAAIHDAGLIHRDVKPSNVMLTRDGQVKLLDLGLVLDGQAAADLRVTTVGHVVGTLVYAAPEQLSNDVTLDGRADLYGVGATLFQLLTATTAHNTDRGIAPLVIDKATGVAKSIRALRPDLDPSISDLVQQLMHRDRDQRPGKASIVSEQLLAITDGESLTPLVGRAMKVTDDSDPNASLIWPSVGPASIPPRRRSWVAWGLGGFAALVVAAIVIIIKSRDQEIVVTADGDDVQVEINEAPINSDAPPIAEQRVYQGKPLSYWQRLMVVERDTKTLGDAMNAIASLAEPDDADAAQQVLIASRRYGGWILGSDDPSGQFMKQFRKPFQIMMPRPGIQAITRELAAADLQSTAASLWAINDYKQLETFAKTFPELAGELHDAMKDRLRTDPLWSEPGNSFSDPYGITKQSMRTTSLKLATYLDRSLDDEPRLREWIEYRIANIETPAPIQERLDLLASSSGSVYSATSTMAYDSGLAHLDPWELHVATHFEMQLPIWLAVHSALNLGLAYQTSETDQAPFHEQRNQIYLELLQQSSNLASPRSKRGRRDARDHSVTIGSSTLVADESWFWLNQIVSYQGIIVPGPSYRLMKNEALWRKALPLIVEKTSRPQIASNTLSSFSEDGVIPVVLEHEMNQLPRPGFTPPMKQTIRDAFQQAMRRIPGNPPVIED